MQRYNTLNQVKQNLPEIMERIRFLKLTYEVNEMMLRWMEECRLEDFWDNTNHGWWSSLKPYAALVKEQMKNYAEIDYLQDIVNKIKARPEI